jgi:hypothetical protein
MLRKVKLKMSDNEQKNTEEKKAEKAATEKVEQRTTTEIIQVKADTKALEDTMERLKKVELERDQAVKALEKETTDKKKVESTLEEEKTLKEDYENKLKLIGEKRMTEGKKIIMDKAREVFKDEAKLKEIEEGIKDPESLKSTENLINQFYTVFKQGEEEHNKILVKEKEDFEKKLNEKSGGKGFVGLRSEDISNEQKNTANKAGYASYPEMIRDLRKKSHSDNPDEAATAQSQIQELLLKWRALAKTGQSLGEFGPDEKDPKKIPSLREVMKKGGELV